MRRHRYSHRTSRLVPLGVAALMAAACVSQRNIFAPMPGAVEITVADTSISDALDAATQAITNEGLTVSQVDRDHGGRACRRCEF